MASQIFFSVGEPSGDQHAARMIEHIQRTNPSIRMRGFGGHHMREAGCEVDLDLTEHAVVGFVEVLPKLRQFFRFVDQAEDVFRSGNIDAVVLVDFPGFNWHIAKRAKQYNIPVYYYCPPQLWAWGGWRIRKMRRTVDHVLAVLPIEETYFSQRGIPTTYVGHPFFDAVEEMQLDESLTNRLEHHRQDGESLIAVLPGSRSHEVKSNWPLMLQAIRRLSSKYPNARFLVAAYREWQRDWCRDQMTPQDQSLPVEFFLGKTSEVIEASRCAMMVSGSVSLEMMARQTPAVVVYRIGRVMNGFAKCMVNIDSITLPNLMGPKKVYPETLSVGSTEPAVDFLVNSVESMVDDEFYFQQTLSQLDQLRRQFAQPGASKRAADWICQAVRRGGQHRQVA